MKRIATLATATGVAVLTALPAWAQENYPPYPPYPPQGGTEGGTGGAGDPTGGGDLAFTGSDLLLWLVVGVALVALGGAFLARRRARTASQASAA